MDRPALLVIPVAVLAAVVVALRGIVAVEPIRETFDVRTLSLLARGLWSLVAVAGLPTAGYLYGRTTHSTPTNVLGAAGAAAYVGALAGAVVLRVGAGASMHGPVAVETATVAVFALLDAATFGLLVLGGYALTLE